MVPTEATSGPLPNDPILKMTIEEKFNLCQDVSNAHLYVTEEDYNSLKIMNYQFPNPEDTPTYTLNTPLVGDDEVPTYLLSCSLQPEVYVSYGFTDHYFVFIVNDRYKIQLLALAEPRPTLTSSDWSQDHVNHNFWENTKNIGKF